LLRYRFVLPRAAQIGRIGGIAGAGPGGALELQDFRHYVPGDDVRQIDWNAVARTGQPIVRIRREEVSPRVEILLDASRSMAVTPTKRYRAAELATLLLRLAGMQGLDAVLVVVRNSAELFRGDAAVRAASTPCDGVVPLHEVVARADTLRTCGVRIVLSDFLFPGGLETLVGRLSQGASLTGLLQILDAGDADPAAGSTTLVDSETGEQADREVTAHVLARYRARFAALQSILDASARRAHAALATCLAQRTLEDTLREQLLGHILQVRA
jgi:uncharacterized protein (DUF58 family)